MQQIPYIPQASPFTPEQRAWLNGYLAGMFANAESGQGLPAGDAPQELPKAPLQSVGASSRQTKTNGY